MKSSGERAEEPVEASASVTDLQGRPVDVLAESRGKVVVLVFVRADCPISNRYAPALHDLHEAYSPEGVNFRLVYPNPDVTAEEIEQHLEEYDFGFAALHDPQHELVERVGATITPEAAVFDREGKLIYHGRIDNWYADFGRPRAAATTHDLQQAIEAALAGEAVAVPETKAVGCFIADLK